MPRYRSLCLLVGMIFLPLFASQTAQSQGFSKLGSVEADPNKTYTMSQENGPWTIMACSFSDENAKELSQKLVLELRKKYNMEAYVYEKSFTPETTVIGRGIDKYGNPKKMQYQNPDTIRPEYAVFVGNYSTLDDPQAKKDQEHLRLIRPESLGGEGTDQSETKSAFLADVEKLRLSFVKPNEKFKDKGPMGKAFITTNPLLPKEFFRHTELSSFIIDANKDLPYSLLKCPGKYSIKVATFTGLNCIVNSKRHREIEQKQLKTSELEQAALRAHELCRALRANGYEAYEFHDNGESIVTVGSFDRVGTMENGLLVEMDAPITVLMQEFMGVPSDNPSSGVPYVGIEVPGTPIRPDIQPTIINVPGKSAVAQALGNGTVRR
ncbi:MAG: hypothetical protein PHE53_08365 [Thermoguttaceae bacterium]|nr:hypothetical protein [Thermoguttaceae bacterium]